MVSRIRARVVFAAVPIAVAVVAVGCQRSDQPQSSASQTGDVLAVLRDRLPVGLATGFDAVPGGFRPRFGTSEAKTEARVVLPARSTDPLHVEDASSGIGVDVSLRGAREVVGQAGAGYVAYPRGHVSGATVVQRPLPIGTEDFVSFAERPRVPAIEYEMTVGPGVKGLRLVANTLEVLDGAGAPRLRVSPPYIVGADGAQTDATLAVDGCAVDINPAGPWGRAPSPPGAATCTVRVSWNDEAVVYPAVLDPRWTTTTGALVTARQDHTATVLSTGKVLVVGGRSSATSTTGITIAELFDPATGTWSPTTSITGGRWFHTATQLGTTSSSTTSGKALIAGGINGTATVTTAQLYSTSAGTWTAAAGLNAARDGHTATLLSTGNVLVTGGESVSGSTTTVLNTAAVYNPSSGAGSWTAVSTNMATARRFHTATLLTSSNSNFSNRVLIVGGTTGTGTTSTTSVQLFNASTSAWSTTTALSTARDSQTATALTGGNVLITGGRTNGTPIGTALVFTIPSSGTSATWASAGTMNSVRWRHTATLLSGTNVLVSGGASNSGGTTLAGTAELWNGGTTWTATATAMATAVQLHTASLLSSGAVLVAGGSNTSGMAVASSQLYDPSFGQSCTTNSQCVTGFCASGVCCNTACTNQCSACNLTGSVGTCSPKTNGTTCTDGNLCTTGETCQSGTCTGGTAVTCTTDQCHTIGACVPATGCPAAVAKTNGTTCNDSNLCTAGETCQSGACTGGAAVTCTTDQCHTIGACVPATGCPTAVAKVNGTTCNDSNACTTGETCQSGACTGGTAVTCTTDHCHTIGVCVPATGCPAAVAVTCTTDQCHTIGACVPATGCPAAVAKTNGTVCNDGNACTSSETCQTGVCSGGHAQTCSGSGNTSTVAVGSGGGSVTLEGVTVQFPSSVFTSATNVTITSTTNAPPAGMTAYTPIYRFDPDGAQFSTAATVTFVVGTALTNPVIVWSDPGGGWDEIGGTYANGQISASVTHFSQGFVALGQCVGQADGATCTDGNVCTVGDSCRTGLCQPGTTALSVDDSNICTTDSCDSNTGAVHAPVADGTTCNDNKVCTLNDSCHAGVCTGSPSPACVPPGALSLTEIAADKQAGLLPGTYLTPTLFQPMGTAPYDPTSPQSYTQAWAINDAGTTVGYSQGAENEGIGGQMVYPFIADSAGERLLTPYWPSGPTYPTAINQAGWIAGIGGPIAQSTTAQDWSRIVIYPPGASPQPQAPPLPVPVWLGSPIRFWAQAIDNVLGSAGLPTITGYSTYTFGGTKDVWHLDNSVAAAVGPHSLSGLPASPEWTTGHTGAALHMNGSVCLSTPVVAGTLPYVQPGITMMAWVKPDAAMCPGGPRTILARTTDYAMSLACNADNSAAALTGQTWIGSFWAPTPAGTVPFGQWSHVAITWDYHTMRAFVNGALVSELTAAGTAVGSYQQTVSVGCLTGAPAMNFVGALDEISTFDVPMGADQINLYMNGTTDYRASAQYHDVARFKDGFFDIVLGPSDPIYTGSVDPYKTNDLGMIVGAAFLAGGGTSAVVYDPQKGWTDLNSLIPPDSNWNLQVATAVDETGRFFVGSGRYYGLSAAWRFDSLTGDVINLGNLPFPYSYPDFQLPIIPRSINSKGHVAGALMDQSNFWSQYAFIYTDETGMFPLDDLIDPAQPVTLRDAKQINDNDEVVGISWHRDNTTRRGYKLSIPSSLPTDLTPVLQGIATGGPTGTKAIFTYTTAAPTITIPYGPPNGGMENALSDQNGFIASPLEKPPQTFVSEMHAPFVATLTGTQLKWSLGALSATATPQSNHLPTTTLPDGTRVAMLPDGSKVNLDSGPPADPTQQNEPTPGAVFAGSIKGTLTVGPSGAALYTLPIVVPPGIAGMTPNLTLQYSSQGGDGIAGQGWGLTGQSMIYRCPKTRAQDGMAMAVEMTPFAGSANDDALCLDGKRLFLQGDGTYRAELNDLSVVTRSQDSTGKDRFTIATKSGQTRYYGFHDYSRAELPGDAMSSYTSAIAMWALDRVVDSWGNYYDLHYNSNIGSLVTTQGLLLTEIDYTGHLDSNGDSNKDTFAWVKFVYDPIPRPDIRHLRFANSQLKTDHRLATISTQLGTYTLNYLPHSDPTLPTQLDNIAYCTVGGTCPAPLHFTWGIGGGYGWQQQGTAAAVGQANTYDLPTPLVKIDGSGNPIASGVQLVDLDGDGRLDLVQAVGDVIPGTTNHVWLNNGHGWTPNDAWVPSTTLAGPEGRPDGFFADIDGDGLPDLITESTFACPDNHDCISGPWISLNRLRTGGGWQLLPETDNTPYSIRQFSDAQTAVGWHGFDLAAGDTLADMDGDGRADVVHFGKNATQLVVLLNTGSGWQATTAYGGTNGNIQDYQLVDVNRDGLPDLMKPAALVSLTSPSNNIYINTGKINPATGNVWQLFTTPCTPGVADIDGDGLLDGTVVGGGATHAFSTGCGCTKGGADNYESMYFTALNAFPQNGFSAILGMIDINQDGLADLIAEPVSAADVPTLGTNKTYINTGTTWAEAPQLPTIPLVPVSNSNFVSQAVDLNGDGVTDLLSSGAANSGASGSHGAWLNTYQPPAITDFPNGLGVNTHVNYTTITTADAHNAGTYTDDDPLEGSSRYLAVPVRVVANVQPEDGTGNGTTNTTTYGYHSLRNSKDFRGPQGFRRIISSDSASKVSIRTTYFQGSPYTGLVKTVERLQGVPFNLFTLTRTETSYCDSIAQDSGGNLICSPPGTTYAPGTSLFVYPSSVTDSNFLNPDIGDEANGVSTTIETRYDALGNVVKSTATTTKTEAFALETFVRTTENTYGTVNSQYQLQGKPSLTTVTANASAQVSMNTPMIAKPTRIHKTDFQYKPVSTFGGASGSALALTMTRTEPGAGWPLEADVAYEYDMFGNTVTTTSCASDFSLCGPGVRGPGSPTDPMRHPLFRTTRTSYRKTDFNAPTEPGLINSLSYSDGRFPVKRTNAAGHTEYTAYDPIKGVIVQQTGPNGIHTCYGYDDMSRQTSETSRCGTSGQYVTTKEYHLSNVEAPLTARVTTISRPPTGATSWTSTDDQDKVVQTLTRSFDGGFIKTLTEYDALGRQTRTSKPFEAPAAPVWTTSFYDGFNRKYKIQEDLGVIDASGTDTISTLTTTFNGSSLTSTRTVKGQTVTRSEAKNAIGKPVSVTDANNATMSYNYDADGNLLSTTDPAGNQVVAVYDTRGRKVSTTDPDLGTATYVVDGFGDVVGDVDAIHQAAAMTCATDSSTCTHAMLYDTLSRMISQTDATGTAQWVYDVAPGAGIGQLAAVVSAPDQNLTGQCSIPRVSVTGGNRTGRSYTYTAFGDTQDVTECVDGNNFVTSYGYDPLGREILVRYPAVHTSQLAVGYHYTSLGYLQYLTDESTDYSVLWQAKTVNALGQVTDEVMRNGVETVANRNPNTGWLLGSTSTAHSNGDTLIQSQLYGYDEAGNLLSRQRLDSVNSGAWSETFTYDLLQRMKTSQVTTPSLALQSYGYDALGLGNLTSKAGTTYTYGAGCLAGTRTAGPHAVCTVGGGPQFAYDGNGNLTSNANRTVSYNSMNKALTIVSEPAGSQVEFVYGADGNRVVQNVTAGATTARTVYVGLGGTGKSLYERTIRNGVAEHVHFIYANGAHGGNAFAVRVLADDGSVTSNRYFNFDHLGSTTTISDDIGHVASVATAGAGAGVLGYDAWGARRNPDGTPANPATFNLQPGHREFTGHETIPEVGLVNMNGRVYDPTLGRFLSPDPNIQSLGDLQSYNRYTYVLNNPLRYTDPTGYFSIDPGAVTVGDFMIGVAAIVVCAGSDGLGCGLAFAFATAGFNATVVVVNGAGFDQAANTFMLSVAAGGISAGLGAELGGVLGQDAASQIISGMVSASAFSVFQSYAANGKMSWTDLEESAAMGGMMAAFSWAASGPAQVSKADLATKAGDGGGTGEARLEARFLAGGLSLGDFNLQNPIVTLIEEESANTGITLATNDLFAPKKPIDITDFKPEGFPDITRPSTLIKRGGVSIVIGIGAEAAAQVIFWGGSVTGMLAVDTNGGVGLVLTPAFRGGIGFGAALGPAILIQAVDGGVVGLRGPSLGLVTDLGAAGSYGASASMSGGGAGVAPTEGGLKSMRLPSLGENFFLGTEIGWTFVLQLR